MNLLEISLKHFLHFIGMNRFFLITAILIFAVCFTNSISAQSNSQLTATNAGKQVALAKPDSVKTIYAALKDLFNKNKSNTKNKAKLKSSTKVKKSKASLNNPVKNKQAKNVKNIKENKVAKKPIKAENLSKTKKSKVVNKKPSFFGRSLKKNKLKKDKAKSIANKNAKKGSKPALYIDTLYYIEPIPAKINYDYNTAGKPNKAKEADAAKANTREVEIGEHKDYFSFNKWEIPEQPDEFIQEKIDNFPSIMPLVFNDDVKRQIKELTKSVRNRRWVEQVLGRTEMYFPLYEKVFDRYGIPVEMKYLSVIESGLNPKATSPMGAKGLWQFIPETAKHYGLKNNSIIDDARDPKKATKAAAEYLNKMYSEFGDWFLAMCAYNCGPGNVRKALRRSKDGSRDFWSIKKYLPQETRRYIPKFIAMLYVLNNYEAHNLTVKELEFDLRQIDTIHLHQKINTNDLVKYCGIKKDHIKLLNPILKTNETPEPNPTFVFNIPYSKLENVLNYRDVHMSKEKPKSKAVPDYGTASLSGEIIHRVKSGENLDIISKRYGVSVSDLQRWNGLKNHIIIADQNLYIYK